MNIIINKTIDIKNIHLFIIKLHAALHRSTLKRVKMHVASATCVGPLQSTDQLDGIGLFIVPCVPNISLFIVEILQNILVGRLSTRIVHFVKKA